MATRPRLLFLSPIIPAQHGNGLAMRTSFFLEAYARHFDVDLVVLPILVAPETTTAFVQARVAHVKILPAPPSDAHFALIAATIDSATRLAAFIRYGRPSLASRASAAARQMVEPWTKSERYQVVHIERLYLAPVIEQWMSLPSGSRPRLVIDCDDNDETAYRQFAALEHRRGRPEVAAWAEAEAAAFSLMARTMLGRFDLAFAASKTAARSLSTPALNVAVVPNVAPAGRTLVQRRKTRGYRTVLFVGSMGYLPNDDAAHWLLTRIWPRLRRLLRTPVRLMVVGSDPSARLLKLARRPDVVVTGTVPEIAPFYRIADLAVIPVRAGSGTRIKLLEAAAQAVPVVSTTLGAEGTTFRHGHELLLADTEERFAHACADLLRDRSRAARLARRARMRIAVDYNASCWSRQVGDLVAAIVN